MKNHNSHSYENRAAYQYHNVADQSEALSDNKELYQVGHDYSPILDDSSSLRRTGSNAIKRPVQRSAKSRIQKKHDTMNDLNQTRIP